MESKAVSFSYLTYKYASIWIPRFVSGIQYWDSPNRKKHNFAVDAVDSSLKVIVLSLKNNGFSVQNPGWLGYIRDYIIQLYRDYNKRL